MVVKYQDFTPEKKEQMRVASMKYYNANKEKSALRAKNWRDRNRVYVLTKQREGKRERKLWAIEYLGGCCSTCGRIYHPAVYEFHHTDPITKDRDPSKMLQLSLDRLTKELDKCVLLCANCHRVEHHGENYSN